MTKKHLLTFFTSLLVLLGGYVALLQVPPSYWSVTLVKLPTPARVRQCSYLKVDVPLANETQRGRSLQDEILQRFETRLKTLRHACCKYGGTSLFKPLGESKLVTIPAFRRVVNASAGYCPIPKTSSTTWKGILKSINRTMKEMGVKAVTPRNGAARDVLFFFTREPYGRLLSGYVDKLFTPNRIYWEMIGRYIVANFRQSPSKKSLSCGHDVTFQEFIKYVIHSQKTGKERDPHFAPTHDQCNMCEVPYNYIGHQETFDQDTSYLLQEMQSPVHYTSRKYFNSTVYADIRFVLRDNRRQVQRCMSLEEACRRLWRKWQIRGIISKTLPFPLTPKQTRNISLTSFNKLALAAVVKSRNKPKTKLQKGEALKQAFAQVPLLDRLEVQKLLFLDFELFGFNRSPESVFPTKKTGKENAAGFRYFKLFP